MSFDLQIDDVDIPNGGARSLAPGHRSLVATKASKRWSVGRVRDNFTASFSRALEQRRLIVLLPFGLIIGLVIYSGLPFEPQPWALWSVAIVLALATILSLGSIVRLRILMLIGALWLGFCLLQVHGYYTGTQMLARPVFGEFSARVDEILSVNSEGRRIIVSALVPSDPRNQVTIKRARLFLKPEPPLIPGDRIIAMLRLAPVPRPVLPGSFDGQFHAYFDGVGAYGNVTSGLTLVSHEAGFDSVRWIDGLRRTIGARIAAVLDGPASAVGWAMVAGDQSDISDETREVMAASGLAHIYSISGLHLSIVAGGMFVVLRLVLSLSHTIGLTLPIKKIAAVGGIVVACFYLLLAGGLANVPALRSTIMLALIFGAVVAGRRALTMRNVALTALLIILIDPASIFRASFQLSFSAVVALIGAYENPRPPATHHVGTIGRWAKGFMLAAVTSLIAGGATALFSAYHFQQTAPLGVLANMAALPVVSFIIMPTALLSVLAMPFGAEGIFLTAMGWGIDRMLDIGTIVAGWSRGLELNPLLTPVALLIGALALGWFAFLSTRWRLLGPIIALPLVMLFGLDQRPDVLIADSTQALALRSESGLGLVAGKTGTFAVDVWSEQYGEDITPLAPGVRCDTLGCVGRGAAGFNVALVKNRDGFGEDCGHAHLVVTRLYAPAFCREQALVIDAGDLARGGVHWLRWQAQSGTFEIRRAVPNLTRPWRASRQ